MIRVIRRRLRRIRYYSARQDRTIWGQLADGSLIVSLVLSVPGVYLANRLIKRDEPAYRVAGMVQRDDDDARYRAYISSMEKSITDFGIPRDERFAAAVIESRKLLNGFPFITSETYLTPTIDLRAWGTARTMPEVETGRGSALGLAMREALASSEVPGAKELASLLKRDERQVDHLAVGWVASWIMWWIGLFVVFSVLLLVARLGTVIFFRQRNRQIDALQRAGKCPSCGYDLRGLEFSERCPECGELQPV